VAETIPKIRAVAATAFQDTLRRKVLWIVLALIMVIGFFMGSSMIVLRLASQAGEMEIGQSIRSSIVSGALNLWSGASVFLALFLGAIGLSSETSTRTIVGVLARPVERWAYLTGRWIGVLAFLWGFQLVGMSIALALTYALGVTFAPTLWLGLAGMFVNAALLSGVSLGLSVVAPPVLAGICAFLLPLLPVLVNPFLGVPNRLLRLPALVIYYLAPARMPADLVAGSFSKELVDPTYGLYAGVLAENFLYAVAAFALGCVLFARRELKLR
jgi:ABC-type transport system involved in multi-copper enzyme maturation permease subunit